MQTLMNVNYESDRMTLSARELHKGLEISERFSTWFERMNQYGFTEGVDYVGCKTFNTLARQELQDFQITIEMAKHIAMVQRSEIGMALRNYFIELEKRWNSPEQVIARGLIESQKMIASLNSRIEEMQPKVDFYDAVAESKNAIPMDQVAKVLNMKGIGRNKLFELLRDYGILQKNNIPYQSYVDRGYFRVVESKFTKPNAEVCISIKTLVYQKGVDFIRKKLEKEMMNNENH